MHKTFTKTLLALSTVLVFSSGYAAPKCQLVSTGVDPGQLIPATHLSRDKTKHSLPDPVS